MTGSGFSVLSVEVYSMARKGITMEINAISTLLFALVMILILGYYFLKRSQQKRLEKRGGIIR